MKVADLTREGQTEKGLQETKELTRERRRVSDGQANNKYNLPQKNKHIYP